MSTLPSVPTERSLFRAFDLRDFQFSTTDAKVEELIRDKRSLLSEGKIQWLRIAHSHESRRGRRGPPSMGKPLEALGPMISEWYNTQYVPHQEEMHRVANSVNLEDAKEWSSAYKEFEHGLLQATDDETGMSIWNSLVDKLAELTWKLRERLDVATLADRMSALINYKNPKFEPGSKGMAEAFAKDHSELFEGETLRMLVDPTSEFRATLEAHFAPGKLFAHFDSDWNKPVIDTDALYRIHDCHHKFRDVETTLDACKQLSADQAASKLEHVWYLYSRAVSNKIEHDFERYSCTDLIPLKGASGEGSTPVTQDSSSKAAAKKKTDSKGYPGMNETNPMTMKYGRGQILGGEYSFGAGTESIPGIFTTSDGGTLIFGAQLTNVRIGGVQTSKSDGRKKHVKQQQMTRMLGPGQVLGGDDPFATATSSAPSSTVRRDGDQTHADNGSNADEVSLSTEIEEKKKEPCLQGKANSSSVPDRGREGLDSKSLDGPPVPVKDKDDWGVQSMMTDATETDPRVTVLDSDDEEEGWVNVE